MKILSVIILERLRDAIDKQLRDEHTGLCPNRFSDDQQATLGIIIVQGIEINVHGIC